MPMGLMTSVLSLTTLRPMDLDIKAVVNPEAKQVVMRTLLSQTPHGLRQQGIKTWRSFLLFYVFLDPAITGN